MSNPWQIQTVQYDKTNSEGNADNLGYGQISILLDKYVLKEKGKGLSSNDFTDDDADKLNSVENGAEVNKLETLTINHGNKIYPDDEKNINLPIPTKTSDLINDGGFAKLISASTSLDYSDSYVGKSKLSFQDEEDIAIGKNSDVSHGGIAIGKNTSTSEIYDINIANKLLHNKIENIWEGKISTSKSADVAIKNLNGTNLNQLDVVINDLSIETQNRIDADTTLQSNISTEVTNRTNADITLQNNINTEIQNRTEADATLSNNLNSEKSIRQTADELLADDIATERTARQNADELLSTSITNATSRISSIEGKIPSQASSSNQLADKSFVNSTIQTNTANFRGNWTTWTDVPSDADLYPQDYSGSKIPTVNDYLVVENASDYTLETLSGSWRFKYTGVWSTNGKSGWIPEYQVNEEPFTSEQLYAINSGITLSKVSSYDSHLLDTSNPHSVTKAQVGLGDVTNVATTSTITSGDTRNITSGAVYTAINDLDNAKQDVISGGATSIVDTDLTANKVLVSDSNGKVAVSSVTSTELSYVSGVTSNIQDQLDLNVKTCTTIPLSPSEGDTILYLGSETSYVNGSIYQYDGTTWKIVSGGGGTVAHFSTMHEWETARLITEGNEGFLADDSLVVIDATNFIYIQNGTGSSATLTQIDASVIEYISTLPVSGIKDKLYCVDPTRPHEEELVGFDILTNKNDDVLFKWWTDESHGTQRAMKFPVDLYQNNELLASISEINPSYGYSTDIYFDYDTSNPNTVGIVHYNSSSNQRIDANTKLVFHDVVRSGEKKLYCGDKENQTVTRFPSKTDVMDALAPTVADANKFLTGSGEWKSASTSIIDSIYPVGSIYWTGNQNFDPNVSFGGTWVQIKDKFIWAKGDNDTLNATGGKKEVILTKTQMPSHNHNGTTGKYNIDHYHWTDNKSLTGSVGRFQRDTDTPTSGILSRTDTTVNSGLWGVSGVAASINIDASHAHSSYNIAWMRGNVDANIPDPNHSHSISSEGGGQAHENMPPYIVKFCWERTA